MDYIPCSKRTFPLHLESMFKQVYGEYLHWLAHLLERLGKKTTLAAWKAAFRDYDDEWLVSILAAKWEYDAKMGGDSVDEIIASLLESKFPEEVDGVTRAEARKLINHNPDVDLIRQYFPSLNVVREISSLDAIHLMMDGFARLAESLVVKHKKKGELIVYDILLEEIAKVGFTPLTTKDFMSGRKERFSEQPKQLDMHSAGLEVALIQADENEVITHVKECEWARYFRKHHPKVGYLLACSRDEAAYRAINSDLRMQRTATLMEGGTVCDFRLYSAKK